MSFDITKENALRLAQVAVVATSSGIRPVLDSVQLAFTEDTLTATVTDSYRLAVYTVQGDMYDQEDVTVLVPAKAFSDAIKNLLKVAPPDYKDEGITLVPSDFDGQSVDVVGRWPNRPEVTIEDITAGATFPNVVSLFNGQKVDGRYRYFEDSYAEVDEATTLPAFKAGFLADIDKLGGTTMALKKNVLPWQMTYIPKASGSSNGNMQPWAWSTVTKDKTMGITYLLMPVSPNGRERT